jgi:putative serine protease PepD
MSEDDGARAPWWTRPAPSSDTPTSDTVSSDTPSSDTSAPQRNGQGGAPADATPTGTGWPTATPSPAAAARPAAPAPAIASPLGSADGRSAGSTSRRSRRGRLIIGVVTLVLASGFLGGALGAWVMDARVSDRTPRLAPAPTAVQTERPTGSIAGIAARVLPAVVSITVRTSNGGGTGSGFVIAPDGHVLTNNHVVESAAGGAGTITVELEDGRSERARIVGRSQDYDLAVLKVDLTGLPAATLGNSDSVVVGDAVIAIGSPLGLSGTVTTGIISAEDRPVIAGDEQDSQSYINALQTDAAINPGNSGGPLVDGNGRVVGVNSAIASLGRQDGIASLPTGSIGLGFAIPINQARDVAQQLIDEGSVRYPVIGVSLDRRFDGDGAKIFDGPTGAGPAVVPDGPSARAGLRAGDVIVRFDGRRITSGPELVVAIRTHHPGDVVSIGYVRGGGPVTTVKVTLGSAVERLSR